MRLKPPRDRTGPAASLPTPAHPPHDDRRTGSVEAGSAAAWGAVVAPVAVEGHPQRPPRNRELDAYTVVAVIASVVYTVYQFCNVGDGLYRGTPLHTVLASLDAAMPFFFVLIGYRVFRPIVVAYYGQAPTVPTRTFLTRHAVAVVPAYYAVVTVVWFCRQQSLPGDWRDLLEHLTFTQVFDPKRIFYTDGPAWAVSVTVFFLLAVAVIKIGVCRLGHAASPRTRLAVLAVPTAALMVISMAWKAWSLVVTHRSTTGSSTTWYGPLANLDSFALGMTVALVVAAVDTKTVGSAHRVALRASAVTAVFIAVATRWDDTWSAAYFNTICSAAFAALIAAAVLFGDSQPRQPLGSSITWTARVVAVAYGTYLWREPVLLTLNGWDGAVSQTPGAFVQDTVLVLVVSVLIGSLSYVAVEQPALQLYLLATRHRHSAHSPPTGPLASIHTIHPAPTGTATTRHPCAPTER